VGAGKKLNDIHTFSVACSSNFIFPSPNIGWDSGEFHCQQAYACAFLCVRHCAEHWENESKNTVYAPEDRYISKTGLW
jgi:hypothetical protein